METIWRNDLCVGVVLSTAYGHSIGRSIAYGYVDLNAANIGAEEPAKKITNAWLADATWRVGDKGEKLAATLSPNAPFDPTNSRIKGMY